MSPAARRGPGGRPTLLGLAAGVLLLGVADLAPDGPLVAEASRAGGPDGLEALTRSPVDARTSSAARRSRRPAANGPKPDFDGDGFADLAVGSPRANVRAPRSGSVHVIHGSAAGLDAQRRRVLTQSTPGMADYPEIGDQFGWTLADGDFDGDGYSDLAITTRWEDMGRPHAGAVHVVHGSPKGLDAEASQLWHQGSRGIRGSPAREAEFGWALAAGDFDGDGDDDLAIGVPRADAGAKDAGRVHVLYGTPDGLRPARSQAWSQDSPGIADRAESGDHFGKALAAGDFDRDGYADLAVGVPYEDRHRDRAGIVQVIRGSARGLSSRGDQVWSQDTPGILERASLRDQFGQSLAVGDIDGDGADDLVVGVWFEDYRNTLSNEGGFHVIYGSRRGLSARDDQFWHQDRPGIQDRAQDSDRFGQALATLDVDGDGFDDVVVGSPSSDLGTGIHQNRGAVHLFRGSRRGLTSVGDRYLTQDTPGVDGRAEAWDHFGETVGGADFDADGFDDLVVGIPWENVRTTNDGAVYVVHGSRGGLALGRDRIWDAARPGRPARERTGAHFGWSVSTVNDGDGSARIGKPRL